MGYQFIHINCYARTGSLQTRTDKHGVVTQARKWSAQEIADEAERKAGACDHVESPMPPTVLYGEMPSVAVRRAENWAAVSRDAKGRKTRSDGLCLLAGVVSLPNERKDDWPRFREAVLHQLKAQYGSRLVSVVEHIDERHPHLHFYVVPNVGESFNVLHPGRQAAAEKAKLGEKKGAQNEAYLAAMRQYQDWFSNAVAADFGLARLGPRLRRLPRHAWRAEVEMGKLVSKQQVSVDVTITADDIAPEVVGKNLLGLKKHESREEVAARLTAKIKEKIAPELRASRSAQSVFEQNNRLSEQILNLKKAQDIVNFMTPEELDSVRLRREELEHRNKMDAEVKNRLVAIPSLVKVRAGAALVFLEAAKAYLESGQELTERGWRRVEKTAMEGCIGHNMDVEDIVNAICDYSPIRVDVDARTVENIRGYITKNTPILRSSFGRKHGFPDDSSVPKGFTPE